MSKRLLRSVLFCPGDRERALIKAVALPTDAIVFDLEDAVGPDHKTSARKTVVSFLQKRSSPALNVVRINCPLSTEWGIADLKAVADLEYMDALILPKVESHQAISMTTEELSWKNSTKTAPIWTMIETAKGVLNAVHIAEHPAVECLVFGANDLTKDLKAKHTQDRQPLLYAMSHCILAARSQRKLVIDGVHIDINDLKGLEISCNQGRNLGFDGKTLIHPKQIDVANKAFSPSTEEIAAAQRIMAAWHQAQSQGKGVVVVDGKLVEALHVEQARIVLDEADRIQQRYNTNQ